MKKNINQKKKGFTLIELLAVIVVLAILALIAVPIVLNIIKDARNNSNKRSIESYARAIDYAVSEYMSENPDQEIVTWEDVKDKVEYKGKVECQWGEGLSSISITGEITLHGCKVNNKTNSIYGYVDGKVTEEKEIVYKEYNVGDEITYKGMKFYVIAPSDTKQDYVTLLKDEPIKYSDANWSTTEIASKISQDSNGYLTTAYLYSDTCVSAGDTSGCSTDYKTSSVKQIVDAWSNKNLSQSNLKEIDGYRSRLITYHELIDDIGFEKNTVCTVSCFESIEVLGGREWIYNEDYSYYWTMSAYNDSTPYVWTVSYYNGHLNHYNVGDVDGSYSGVVRPVINLLKSAI